MVRPSIKELKQNIGSLLQDKYQLRAALENCESYLLSKTRTSVKHPVIRIVRKALRDTEFAKLTPQ